MSLHCIAMEAGSSNELFPLTLKTFKNVELYLKAQEYY